MTNLIVPIFVNKKENQKTQTIVTSLLIETDFSLKWEPMSQIITQFDFLPKGFSVPSRKAVYQNLKPAIADAEYTDNKLFIGKLPLFVSGQDLREHFSKFGLVREATVFTDTESLRSRGFGFVIMMDENGYLNALEARKLHVIKGNWVDCKPAQRKSLIDGTVSLPIVNTSSSRHFLRQKSLFEILIEKTKEENFAEKYFKYYFPEENTLKLKPVHKAI